MYTDESPGLKVDPFVVMTLSIGFIASVVLLHSMITWEASGCTDADISLVIAKITKKFYA